MGWATVGWGVVEAIRGGWREPLRMEGVGGWWGSCAGVLSVLGVGGRSGWWW